MAINHHANYCPTFLKWQQAHLIASIMFLHKKWIVCCHRFHQWHTLKQIMPHAISLEKKLVIVHRCLCKVLMPNSLISHHFAPFNVCFVTWQRPTMVDVPVKHNCKLHVSKDIFSSSLNSIGTIKLQVQVTIFSLLRHLKQHKQ